MTDTIFRNPRFDALRNAIYHTARRNFLDRVNRCLNFCVIVLGAGVAGKIADHLSMSPIYLELSVVVTASAQLVFDLGSRARDHEFLQRRYYDLLADMEGFENPSADQIRTWSAKLLTISGEEPLTMRALDAVAYNNALDAICDDPTENKKYRQKIGWWQYPLRHLFAFHSTHFHSDFAS